MYKTIEYCDHCDAIIGHRDHEGYVWQGIRIEPDNQPYNQKIELPDGDYPKHGYIKARLIEQKQHTAGQSSQGLPGVYLPGVVCSYDCLEAHLLGQLAAIKEKSHLVLHQTAIDKLKETAFV